MTSNYNETIISTTVILVSINLSWHTFTIGKFPLKTFHVQEHMANSLFSISLFNIKNCISLSSVFCMITNCVYIYVVFGIGATWSKERLVHLYANIIGIHKLCSFTLKLDTNSHLTRSRFKKIVLIHSSLSLFSCLLWKTPYHSLLTINFN